MARAHTSRRLRTRLSNLDPALLTTTPAGREGRVTDRRDELRRGDGLDDVDSLDRLDNVDLGLVRAFRGLLGAHLLHPVRPPAGPAPLSRVTPLRRGVGVALQVPMAAAAALSRRFRFRFHVPPPIRGELPPVWFGVKVQRRESRRDLLV